MRRPLPPLNALRAFEAIARHLSFARAADELHVTPAALSHQIKGLEDQLGVPLFHRRARSIELTEAGDMLYPGLHAGFEALHDAIGRLGRRKEDRFLVISATPGFTAKWLVPRLWKFLNQHPEVDPRLAASLAVADFTADGVDVAIRLSDGHHPELYVEKLFDDSVVPVCSPRLIEAGLRTVDDLARFSLIHYDIPTSSQRPPNWSEWLEVAGAHGIDGSRGLRFNVADHALDAAVAAAGVSMSYKLIASDDVHNGRLVIPFGPQLPITERAYHFVCPKGHETRPKVRAFRDWLFAEMAETKAKWVPFDAATSTGSSR
ncbi:glycine cleavage system transcriptional activator [Variibacter gotjawalensis]|uniref:Glycine cleavage system transcriptional activator n=2 Tax=Variibacter gotjawalensis TaxID=1333996 RepID=A0A0S3PZ13_9BRAD|nr:transcriptional regulator GcvA [Variibacter gotjawalensis]RZS48914.1 LysR family transcriptional regulator [Variibacter gotjawalensis]BAT61173.1 glycine cleavage system transcriptional activator [Variibacter gotjawalensis]